MGNCFYLLAYYINENNKYKFRQSIVMPRNNGKLMNQKAFTLFTAMVSFLLIVLAGLLVQSMTSSESNTVDILSDAKELAEMQTIADLARADAIQIVNYIIRYKMEEWLFKEENYYLMDVSTSDVWEDIVADFAASNFGGATDPTTGLSTGRQFATLVANAMTTILQTTPTQFGSYHLALEREGETVLTEIVTKMVEQSSENNDFFMLPWCPKAGDESSFESNAFEHCEKGFYVTLDIRKVDEGGNEVISDADYEGLPKVVVENFKTGRVIKEPIFPRGKFQIYVPLRVFKAIAGAYAIRDEVMQVVSTYENYGIGYCEKDNCNWQPGGTAPPSPNHDMDYFCAAPSLPNNTKGGMVPHDASSSAEFISVDGIPAKLEDLGSASATQTMIERGLEDTIRGDADSLGAYSMLGSALDFILTPDASASPPYTSAYEVKVIGKTLTYNQVVERQTEGTPITKDTLDPGDLFCGRLDSVEVTLKFKEENIKYRIVDKDPNSPESYFYEVRVKYKSNANPEPSTPGECDTFINMCCDTWPCLVGTSQGPGNCLVHGAGEQGDRKDPPVYISCP